MLAFLKTKALVIGIVLAFIIGIAVPIGESAANVINTIGNVGVAGVFLAYGLRIRTSEVLRGLRDIKLQGTVFALTFGIFPLIGLAFYYGIGIFSASPFLLGLLYLTLLPSTIQSSVSFVSIAGGDVARAVCAATISNVVGIFLTPVLVLLFLDVAGVSAGNFQKVLTQLLLPFFIGQLFQPFTGAYLRKHNWITKIVDLFAIITVVLSAVISATHAGVWSKIGAWELTFVISAILIMLGLTLFFSVSAARILKQPKESEIVLIMCGSMKSLATGLPMANAFFPAASVAPLIVPVILYHQIQLFVCSLLADHLGKKNVGAG
ncbi:bile acid:sodium symporter family protein [Arcanobacterium hippocoleae]|uniref:Sodium/bile acid cotransporter 7 n=1 Tax=Arcanobacterium hippocoleae TaxID=149017 RepID=A0ABU1T1S5_9ACTO|nr:bile acid:sodium symporter family protein [Arcanobacterium hippocoleae]MDR6938805.1 sodium/bile acid cotransporter 7 [Arcanobacterium hippocoleae]